MQDAQIINAEHRLPDDTSGVSDEEGDTVTSLVSLVSGKSAKGRLTLSERLSYGVGHVLNDLTAACWFTYLLPFLTETLTYPEAGTVFLSGQIADAIATPLVGFTHFVPANQAAGIYSDRTVSRFGKRKIWAAGGALLVLFSFGLVFPVFNECVPCILFKTSSSIVKVAYYSICSAIFNLGWAALQVAHMVLVPELTGDKNEQVLLYSIRNAFAVLASVAVYGLFYMFCDVAEGDDIWRYLAIACLSIGALATLIFLVGVKEEPTPLKSRHDRNYVEWRAWFKNRYFYFVTFVCLCMRLTVNVTQVYLVAFSLSSLQLGENSKAFMPLALYLASLLTSFVMKPAAKRFDLRVIFFVGAIFACTGLVPMLLLSIFQLDGSLPERVNLASYGFIILFGFANSALIVTALSMEAKLVGDHSESSAFVYGFISFTDKFSNGIAVFVINQFVQDSGSESAAIAFGKNIAYVFALVPSASAVLGSFFAMMCKFDERPKFFRLRSDEIEDK